MDDKNWTLVFTSNKPFQGEIVKQMLENNGIDAVVINKQDSSYLTFGDVEVYVLAGFEVAAKKLIEEAAI
jgi:hypothetical protein